MEDTRYKYGRYKWVLQGALLRQAYGGQSREQGAGSREKIQDPMFKKHKPE
ncbi:MAG TPA: hypothetical protein VJ877_01195 [Bacteroidales bacterium]|nr:hypothetical protein [Bacteroidales bacterium]